MYVRYWPTGGVRCTGPEGRSPVVTESRFSLSVVCSVLQAVVDTDSEVGGLQQLQLWRTNAAAAANCRIAWAEMPSFTTATG